MSYEVFGDEGDMDPEGYVAEDVYKELRGIAIVMLEALKTVQRAIESPEWKEWEGKAMFAEIRAGRIDGTAGYQGEQFMPMVREAIRKAEEEGELDGR